jgi:hypothetical protein
MPDSELAISPSIGSGRSVLGLVDGSLVIWRWVIWQTQLVVHSIEGNRATILAVAAFAAFEAFYCM